MKRENLRCSFMLFGFFIVVQSQAMAYPEPYFSDVTTECGLGAQSAFRITIADVNGDGYPDLYIHEPSNEAEMDVINKHKLYLNVPGDDEQDEYSRKFIDFTEESGIHENRRSDGTGRHSTLGIFGDVDNDGDLDLFTGLYYHRMEYYTDRGDRMDIMLNDGTGRFTFTSDLTVFNTGLLNNSSATFLDYNLDGKLDLYVGNWFYDYANNIWSSPVLFKGNGDGSFVNVTESAGLVFEIPCYCVTAADWNKDGWMDLFTGNYCRGESVHWKNNGNGTFTQVQEETQYGAYIGPGHGPSGNTCAWGSMPRDFDSDGDLDFFEVFVHGGAVVHSCPLVNDGNVFTWAFSSADRTDDPGNMHQGDHYGSWIDVDNDGLPDFVLTECGYDNNRIYCMMQNAEHNFITQNAEAGMNVVNDPNLPPHNASCLDYDLDGDDDLIVGFASADPIKLLRNDIGTLNNWIGIKLEGAGIEGKSNRSAIGARVEIHTPEKVFYREVYAGNGHFGPQYPLSMVFGLGTITQIDFVKVFWPNASMSTIQMGDVDINQYITISEDRQVNPPVDGVRLELPSSYFSPGDPFVVNLLTYNSSDPVPAVPLFVILEIVGQYWFYDAWSQEVDYAQIDIPAGCMRMNIIPEFIWPDTGNSTLNDIGLWAALFDFETGEIVGGMDGLDHITFGFGPN